MTTPRSILLIEDSVDDADLIALELSDAGLDFQLHRVELLPELEAALERNDWALVLCDSRLPGYDGSEAFMRVRERLPDVPVLFCTGGYHDENAPLQQAIEASQGHVAKDDLERLPELVRQLLG